MANHERLSQWVLSHAKDLNLQVTKLDWINSYYKAHSDIAVKIEIDAKIYEGRGSDVDSTVALMKGVAEAIERFACQTNNISSIGVAGHYDLDLAKENALLEFIERTSIWDHFNNKVGMKPISAKNIAVVTKDLGMVSLKIHQFQMNTPLGYFGVFTLTEGLESGFEIGGIMGASVCRSFDEALKKSSIECLRNVAALSTHAHGLVSYEQFKKIEKPTSEDSQALLFDKSYCKQLLEILSADSSEKSLLKSEIENLIFEELPYSALVLKDCPLRFVRCLDQNRSPAPDTEFVG